MSNFLRTFHFWLKAGRASWISTHLLCRYELDFCRQQIQLSCSLNNYYFAAFLIFKVLLLFEDKFRQPQDSNLRRHCPMDFLALAHIFKSIALTTRPGCHCLKKISDTGTRTPAKGVKTLDPNQLDYIG